MKPKWCMNEPQQPFTWTLWFKIGRNSLESSLWYILWLATKATLEWQKIFESSRRSPQKSPILPNYESYNFVGSSISHKGPNWKKIDYKVVALGKAFPMSYHTFQSHIHTYHMYFKPCFLDLMVGNQIDCLTLVFFLVHDFNLEFANGKCKFILKIYFKTFLMILRKPNLDEVYCLHFFFQKFETSQDSNSQNGKNVWECWESLSHTCGSVMCLNPMTPS